MIKKKFKANISLTTVIITTTILLLSGVTVLFSSIDLSHSTESANAKMLNELRAKSCVEEGLIRLKNNILFTGVAAITFNDGSCSNTVSIDPQNNNNRIFTIISIISDYQYTVAKHIDISREPFVIID